MSDEKNDVTQKRAQQKKELQKKEAKPKSNIRSNSSPKKTNTNDPKRPIRADEAVMLRNEFYKDGAKKLKWLIAASSVCLALSSISAYVAVSKEGINNYFAVDETGQYIELITLDRPNHKASVVSQWLTDALVDTFDFNYLNMKQVLNDKAMVWFTDSGRTSLVSSIEESGSFNVIKKEKLIAQLNLIRSPILVREGVGRDGRYEWLMQVEGKFTYTNESSVYVNNVIFTVSITRRSMLEDVKGLGINKIFVEFTGR